MSLDLNKKDKDQVNDAINYSNQIGTSIDSSSPISKSNRKILNGFTNSETKTNENGDLKKHRSKLYS